MRECDDSMFGVHPLTQSSGESLSLRASPPKATAPRRPMTMTMTMRPVSRAGSRVVALAKTGPRRRSGNRHGRRRSRRLRLAR
jgi:hypothetical protein